MTTKRRKRVPKRKHRLPGSDVTLHARIVHAHAKAAVSAFEQAFATVRKARGVTRGTPTDEEQDLLRAAVVFASASLDSTLKQLVENALPHLLQVDDTCRKRFETFVQRQLRTGEEEGGIGGAKLLARVLCDETPRVRLIMEYSEYLTGSSLQSVDELARVLDALGEDDFRKRVILRDLGRIFHVRNEIVHEMDIDLEGTRRKRRSRTKKQMLDDARTLLSIAGVAILRVEDRLRA